METIKKIALEATVILIAATLIGVAWNRHLLVEGFSGMRASVQQEAPVATSRLPLPAGLLQVKDFYDRNEAIIVDARNADTFAGGRIKGAVSLPVGEMAAQLPGFKRTYKTDKPLIVYCNGYGCHDSMTVGQELINAGYSTVFIFEGGYPEWKEAGYQVEGTNP